jgi:hypothetical protein
MLMCEKIEISQFISRVFALKIWPIFADILKYYDSTSPNGQKESLK